MDDNDDDDDDGDDDNDVDDNDVDDDDDDNDVDDDDDDDDVDDNVVGGDNDVGGDNGIDDDNDVKGDGNDPSTKVGKKTKCNSAACLFRTALNICFTVKLYFKHFLCEIVLKLFEIILFLQVTNSFQ